MLSPDASGRIAGLAPATRAAWLLVGPEGGLDDEEVARARAAGWQGLRLGPRVLRTETAGLAALAALQARFGDLG
jgi:16S rRNA (uracil1498-N3)-methyltransferase